LEEEEEEVVVVVVVGERWVELPLVLRANGIKRWRVPS
jgi:hypothetical protein